MPKFSQDFVDELKARVSIVAVVGRHVTWDPRKTVRARGDYWACCPFHGEKSPSFHVMEDQGRYYCFGCQEKGSAIDFVMKLENRSFPDAVEALAKEAGMALPVVSPKAAAQERRRSSLLEVMEQAVAAFRRALASSDGAEARAYLERRGLTAETIARFEIGYAPGGAGGRARDALTRRLVAEGAPLEALIEGDVAGRGQRDGAVYDRFRDRIMFPIRDSGGRCIGFAGRALSASEPAKYVNSRQTTLFDKGRTLYHVGPARAAAAKGAPVVVVEGYMDVIALAEAGFAAVVAPMGTALTADQLAILWRMADEPILMLDGDAAGRRAAHRAADLALAGLQPAKSLRFAWTPDGLDPDDLARRPDGADAVARLIDAAEPLIEILWRREWERGPLDTPERRAALEAAHEALAAQIKDGSVRQHYRQAFRDRRFEAFRAAGAAARTAAGRGGKFGERFGGKFGGKFGGRFGGKFGGRFGREAALGPTQETLALGLGLGRSQADRRRAAAPLVVALNHPPLAAKYEAELDALEFGDARLDMLRNAIISALSDADGEWLGGGQDDGQGDGQDDGQHDPAEISRFELSVEAQCAGSGGGAGLCAALRREVEPWLPRSALRGQPAAKAESAFLDALGLLQGALTVRRETEEYGARIIDTAAPDAETDEEPSRLQSAHRAAEPSAPEVLKDEGEEKLSQWLKSFVDDKGWIKNAPSSKRLAARPSDLDRPNDERSNEGR